MFRSFLFVVSFVCFSTVAKAEFFVEPTYEGVYDINVTCEGVVSPSECSTLAGEHKISIINSMMSDGVRINLSHGKYSFSLYEFSVMRYEQGGAVLEGETVAGSRRSAELHLEIDPSTKAVSGWIWDATISGTIRISGKQRVCAGDWYSSEPTTVGLTELEGVYEGGGGSLAGRLILKRKAFGGGTTFTASFVNANPGVTFHFPITEFLPARSVVNLIGDGKDYSLKWTLQLKTKEDGTQTLKGVGFSSLGKGGYVIDVTKKSGITAPTP